jgi:hypothetical protein
LLCCSSACLVRVWCGMRVFSSALRTSSACWRCISSARVLNSFPLPFISRRVPLRPFVNLLSAVLLRLPLFARTTGDGMSSLPTTAGSGNGYGGAGGASGSAVARTGWTASAASAAPPAARANSVIAPSALGSASPVVTDAVAERRRERALAQLDRRLAEMRSAMVGGGAPGAPAAPAHKAAAGTPALAAASAASSGAASPALTAPAAANGAGAVASAPAVPASAGGVGQIQAGAAGVNADGPADSAAADKSGSAAAAEADAR